MVIDLPNQTSILPLRTLQRHVPELARRLRASGNRVIAPLPHLAPFITNTNQIGHYSDALEAVFAGIDDLESGDAACAYDSSFEQVDLEFQQTLFLINQYRLVGDDLAINRLVEDYLHLLFAVAEVLDGKKGVLGAGRRLAARYLHTAEALVPYVGGLGPDVVFVLVEIVCLISERDPVAVNSLVSKLSLDTRDELQLYAQMLAMTGDVVAMIICSVI